MIAQHSDYPHEPGTLHDCAACEAECFCDPGSTACVHCAIRRERNWLTLEVCTDCVCLIANGEATDSDGNDIAPALAAATVERWGRTCIVLGDDDEAHFSWRPCEACGGTLGGDRLTAYAERGES